MPLSRMRQFEAFCREYEKAPLPTAQLAELLGVSERTIERYRQRYRALRAGEEPYAAETPAERAVRFLFWLSVQGRPVKSGEALDFFVREFSTSRRTAQRVLASLKRQGLIASGLRGYEFANHLLPRLRLLPEEIEELAVFIETYGGKGPLGRHLESVLAKLRLGVSGLDAAPVVERAGKRQKRLLVKGPRCAGEAGSAALMEDLLDAAEAGRRLRLVYRSPQYAEDYRPTVLPRGVVYNWLVDEWYLVACNEANGQTEFYRLDRLLEYECAAPEAQSKPLPAPGADLRNCWGTENGPLVEVRVRFHDDFNVHDKVRRDVAGRERAVLHLDRDGMLVLKDIVAGLGEFSRWLRQFGASAEVLDPPELVELIRAGARRKLERYGVEAT